MTQKLTILQVLDATLLHRDMVKELDRFITANWFPDKISPPNWTIVIDTIKKKGMTDIQWQCLESLAIREYNARITYYQLLDAYEASFLTDYQQGKAINKNIDKAVSTNNGRIYSPQIFHDARKKFQEEKDNTIVCNLIVDKPNELVPIKSPKEDQTDVD